MARVPERGYKAAKLNIGDHIRAEAALEMDFVGRRQSKNKHRPNPEAPCYPAR